MKSRRPMMEPLVRELCSPTCSGRAPGTPGGIRARGLVRDALRDAGLDPIEQPIGTSKGANLLATMKGDFDRWVLVAAHYDHLGGTERHFFPGADDNAAAVAILVEVARSLVEKRADGRGVIIAAFDAEEPPYFLTGEMGSAWFTKRSTEIGVPLDQIDLMVCMDLVGHDLGPEGLPGDLRGSMFALGAERSEGTSLLLDDLSHSEPGLTVRRADAEIIPPLSDYDAFWKREVPFLFLTSGRSARYHTPEDTPEHLAWPKIERTARWLDRLVRHACTQNDGDPVKFLPNARDDASTLRGVIDLLHPLVAPHGSMMFGAAAPLAQSAIDRAKSLLDQCDDDGRLPSSLADAPSGLVLAIENALAGA